MSVLTDFILSAIVVAIVVNVFVTFVEMLESFVVKVVSISWNLALISAAAAFICSSMVFLRFVKPSIPA